MAALSQQQRHDLLNTNQAMLLNVESVFKIIQKGGATQTKEVEISINLMQKALDTMKKQIAKEQ